MASAPGGTISGIKWSMIDATGAISNCVGASLTCSLLIKKDGTLTVTAMVDGVLQQASVQITVNKVPCPTGDSLLDLPQVARVLSQAWLDSKPDAPAAERRERAAWLLQDPNTGVLSSVLAYDAGASPCSNSPPFPKGAPPLTIVASFHTHPFARRELLPSNCTNTTVERYAYDPIRWGGPSKADWDFASGGGLPTYVLDEDNLFRAVPIDPVTQSNALANVQKYSYPSRCR